MKWTETQKEQLLEMIESGKSYTEAARRFGTTKKSIENLLHRMQLGAKKEWSPEEDEFLEANYKELTNYELAQRLGCRVGQVEHRLRARKLLRRSFMLKGEGIANRPPARYSNPDYTHIDRYYQKERSSYYAQ